jgi:hypothetical protein
MELGWNHLGDDVEPSMELPAQYLEGLEGAPVVFPLRLLVPILMVPSFCSVLCRRQSSVVSDLYRRQSRVSFVLSCIEDKSVLALVCIEDKAELGFVSKTKRSR